MKNEHILNIYRIKALQFRAEIFNLMGRSKEALGDTEALIKILKGKTSAGAGKSLPTAITLKAFILGYLERFDESMDCWKMAERLFRKNGDARGAAAALISISAVHEARKDYRKALKCCFKALKILERTKMTDELANAYNNLGMIFHSLNDLDKAVSYYQKGLDMRTRLNDRIRMGESYNNLAFAFEDKGDVKTALNYYGISLIIRTETGHKRGEGITLANMAHLYKTLGDKEKAKECYVKASGIFRAINENAFAKKMSDALEGL